MTLGWQQLRGLNKVNSAPLQEFLLPSKASRSIDLKVHIERIEGDRKPISILFRGRSDRRYRLSVIRASALIVLLLDLARRRSGLDSLHDFDTSILDVARLLGDSAETVNKEQIRVARYRLVKAWEKEYQQILEAELDKSSFLLQPISNSYNLLRISSSDPTINRLIQNYTNESRLARIKREGSLFIPADDDASDEFLYEIWQQPSDLQIVSAYTRIANASLPTTLAEKFIKTPIAKARYELTNKRMREGSAHFTEIVNESFFIQLCSRTPVDSRYSLGDALTLLEELIRRTETLNCYRLVITRAEFSFLVGTHKNREVDCTSFYKVIEGSPNYSTFAVYGESLRRSVTEGFFRWIFEHPTTIEDKRDVNRYLRELYSRAMQLM